MGRTFLVFLAGFFPGFFADAFFATGFFVAEFLEDAFLVDVFLAPLAGAAFPFGFAGGGSARAGAAM